MKFECLNKSATFHMVYDRQRPMSGILERVYLIVRSAFTITRKFAKRTLKAKEKRF